MSIKVFLSVGRTSTPQQEKFVQAVEAFLASEGLLPRTVGRNYFSDQQPLKTIREVMGQCAGTVIVAYERIHIAQGKERRGSPKETALNGLNLPTVLESDRGNDGLYLGATTSGNCRIRLKR